LFGNAIIIEASLSFLGLGTPPPTPSRGAMLSVRAGIYGTGADPGLFPGLAISIAVLAFQPCFGDMPRDILDPNCAVVSVILTAWVFLP